MQEKTRLRTYKTERDLSRGTEGMLSTTELYHPGLIFKFAHKNKIRNIHLRSEWNEVILL